jgi:WW domain
MSNNASKSASAKPSEDTDHPKASTSQYHSPDAPASNAVDDKPKDNSGKDGSGKDGPGKDDTTPDEKDNDRADGSLSSEPPSSSVTPSQGDWQAIWAPMQNAYYFYNSVTNETTWANPLQPQPAADQGSVYQTPEDASYPSTSTSDSMYAAHSAAEVAGIDPSLAYLDPSLGLPGSTPAGTFTAKFNARTGAFTRLDARDPSHLSESERAKRMSEVYFDVGAWEKELEQRQEEEESSGKKRKRPSKKDLVCRRDTKHYPHDIDSYL